MASAGCPPNGAARNGLPAPKAVGPFAICLISDRVRMDEPRGTACPIERIITRSYRVEYVQVHVQRRRAADRARQHTWKAYDKDIAEARRRGDRAEEITDIESVAQHEDRTYEDEVYRLHTRYLWREANRLMIPTPNSDNKASWQEEYGHRHLTTKGVNKLRNAIRLDVAPALYDTHGLGRCYYRRAVRLVRGRAIEIVPAACNRSPRQSIAEPTPTAVAPRDRRRA